MFVRCLALLVAGMLAGCEAPQSTGEAVTDSTLVAMAAELAGAYTSAAQARGDPEFHDIELHVAPMWTKRDDGPWLYAEFAEAGTPNRPYRQRVHQLAFSDDPVRAQGTMELRVFELPGDPLAFAGAWSDPKRFDLLNPGNLLPRAGCTIFIVPGENNTWSGSTDLGVCPSSLRTATTSTIQLWLGSDELRWWERGFDDSGKQVWGAVKGPIQFVKESAASK